MAKGNLINRLVENGKDLVDEIKVGMKATEYLWSDRTVYEVVEVISQKEVKIRRMDAKCLKSFSQEWELSSNPNNPVLLVKKARKYWYEIYEGGKSRIKIRFGVADYHYDWSF